MSNNNKPHNNPDVDNATPKVSHDPMAEMREQMSMMLERLSSLELENTQLKEQVAKAADTASKLTEQVLNSVRNESQKVLMNMRPAVVSELPPSPGCIDPRTGTHVQTVCSNS